VCSSTAEADSKRNSQRDGPGNSRPPRRCCAAMAPGPGQGGRWRVLTNPFTAGRHFFTVSLTRGGHRTPARRQEGQRGVTSPPRRLGYLGPGTDLRAKAVDLWNGCNTSGRHLSPVRAATSNCPRTRQADGPRPARRRERAAHCPGNPARQSPLAALDPHPAAASPVQPYFALPLPDGLRPVGSSGV
jgi:hypothetical protein